MPDEFDRDIDRDSLPPATELIGRCQIRVGATEGGEVIVLLTEDEQPIFSALMDVEELSGFVRDAVRVIGRLNERRADTIGATIGSA